jgi:hypothetical protein
MFMYFAEPVPTVCICILPLSRTHVSEIVESQERRLKHNMRAISAYLIVIFLAAAASLAERALAPAQSDADQASSESAHLSLVEGTVVKDPGSEPLKKAVVELIAESQNDGSNYTAVTGPDGRFQIENIAPGRYRMFVERTVRVKVACLPLTQGSRRRAWSFACKRRR